jgi:hypothetical protein
LRFDDEYAIGQVLDNGFTVTWTTSDSALDAVRKCVAVGDSEMSATIRHGQDGRAGAEGAKILDFLEQHDCWWVKLRREGLEDYVIYAAGPAGVFNELATLGPPMPAEKLREHDDHARARVDHIRAMMKETASPSVKGSLKAVLRRLIATVET